MALIESSNARATTARHSVALAVVCLSALIINIDSTILNVALPTLVRDLDATSSQLQWIVDVYAMVFAGLLLVGGSLADRWGRKGLFLAGLVIFAGGSFGAAFSGSVHLLIGWRAVMGAGGALTIPSSLAIINDLYHDPAQRARAIGIWGGTAGLGIALGPIAGGLLLSRFWWGSIFMVNVPIAVIAALGALVLVANSRNLEASAPDPLGAVLSIVGMGMLLWAIIEAPSLGWSSPPVLGVGLASLAVLGGFVLWEARSTHPMLALAFFKNRRFSIAAAAETLGAFGLVGGLFLQTQFLQFDRGYSALAAGVRILPIAGMLIVAATMSPLATRVLGAKLTVSLGLMAIAGGLWQISLVSNVATTYAAVVPGSLLIGLGAGLLIPTATNCVVGSVPLGDGAVASASNSVALQVGGALGVAVIGSVMSTRYQGLLAAALVDQRLPPSITHTILGSLGGALGVAASVGGVGGALLAHAARGAFMSGAGLSFAVGAVVALAGAILALALPSREGSREGRDAASLTTKG